MHTQLSRSLINLSPSCRVIPIVESRLEFAHALERPDTGALFVRHSNLFDLVALLERAKRHDLLVYVNMDHIDGIHADAAGLRYLAEQLHISGIVSTHPKTLALGKGFGLETIQRIFVVDSTGLETSLETVDLQSIDLLDLSPALVVPHIVAHLARVLPLPFIGSGLISKPVHIQAVLKGGALGVAVPNAALGVDHLARHPG